MISKIIVKKEFSFLPKKDVERAFNKFDNPQFSDEEKIKLTRNLLRKVYTAFLSDKLLNPKEKNFEWFLKKHVSTRERFPFYAEVYRRIFAGLKGKVYVYDLGCGVNGFSYPFLSEINSKVFYRGVEAVGQLVSLQKHNFKGNKNLSFILGSIFDVEKVKHLISKDKGKKIVFLFKVVDSIEMLERNFSKQLLIELSDVVDKIVVSFASRSIGRGRKFFANRGWIKKFLQANFLILDKFEFGGEEYFVVTKKNL